LDDGSAAGRSSLCTAGLVDRRRGVARLVWDGLHGEFDPARVKDVDLAFYDLFDLSRAPEAELEHALAAYLPGVIWDAKNQAAVHIWYQRRFGVSVPRLVSAADGVATWPETATAVAIRLCADDALEVLAPCGLADLVGGVCRRNPRRVTVEEYRRRVLRKQVAQRWPKVVIEP
jgi:uncharacterized protein